MYDNLKGRAISSVLIKLCERLLTTGAQVGISIIIARLLSPDAYGIIALISVFITLSNVFIESGFGVGLVQKKELGDKDIHTVFISSVILSVVLYFIIFIIAPFVGNFYGMDDLVLVLRIYAISIIFASVCSVFNSIVSRKLEYKKQLLASIISTFVSGAVGVWMAYQNYGVWALVFQQLAQRFMYMIVMFIAIRYVPKLEFSKRCFQEILSFSWKIVATKMISTFYNEVRNLIVGKMYSSEVLGYFNKGQQIPATVATATDYSLQSVMFSVYSKSQDDIVRLKEMVRRSMKLSAYILFPMMVGLITIANPLVNILLTEKWMACVPFFQIACCTYMLQPVNSANMQAINALGRSDISLKKEIVKRIFATILIVFSVFINVYAIAISAFIVQLFGWIQYMFLNKELLNYGMTEQLGDICPIIVVTTIMGVITYYVGKIELSNWIVMIMQIMIGFMVYIILSFAFKLDCFTYILNTIKEKRRGK